MPYAASAGMISNRVERRKPYATEEEVLVTRIDSVRHAADRRKDSVRHAADVMAPYASTAKTSAVHYAGEARQRLTPKVTSAAEQARAAPPPAAEQRASPLSAVDVLQNRNIQHRLGQQLLQLAVLIFERLQPLGIPVEPYARAKHVLLNWRKIKQLKPSR